MDRLRLLVLFGGMAEEHDISVKSARQLAQWIDERKYDTTYLYITRNGVWKAVSSPDADISSGTPAFLSPSRGFPGLIQEASNGFVRLRIDAAFPMLHGHFGEDGAIQGLLELSGIPYVGCGIAGSALCMDKSLTYLAASAAGIQVPAHIVVRRNDAPRPDHLRFPVFVKPACSGSSFGVSKVLLESGMDDAVRDARRYADRILIEESITGREIGCALLGDEDEVITGEPDEIVLTNGFFRIHQEKAPESGSENASVRVPARVTAVERKNIQQSAITLFRALGLRGLARVDLFLKADGQIVLNEVNTMPGMTSYSRYPRMMEGAGIPMRSVVDRLIQIAMKAGERK